MVKFENAVLLENKFIFTLRHSTKIKEGFKMKNTRYSIVNCLFVTFILMIFASTSFAADFLFRVSTSSNAESVHYAGMTKFKELVEKRSNGKIEVKLFHSGAIGDDVANLEALKVGTLEIGTCDTPITTVDSLLGVFALPYIFRDREHVYSVMNGPVGTWTADRLRQKGLEVLAYFEGGFRQVTNNKRPINEPADLKGVKMRTPSSALRIKMFNHYGANAAALPYPELYSALQMGAFDGQENPAIEIKSQKFWEVQKYLSFTNHVYTISYFLMSQAVYKKLPWDLQLVVKQAAYEAALKTVEVGKKADEDIAALSESKGMKINKANVAAFVEASKPVWDDYAKEQGQDTAKLIAVIEAAGKP
jgi:tripartite ATP-independent transporter DctP family solute receptor